MVSLYSTPFRACPIRIPCSIPGSSLAVPSSCEHPDAWPPQTPVWQLIHPLLVCDYVYIGQVGVPGGLQKEPPRSFWRVVTLLPDLAPILPQSPSLKCLNKFSSLPPSFLVRSTCETKRRNFDLRQFSCGQCALQSHVPSDSWICRGKLNIFSHISHSPTLPGHRNPSTLRYRSSMPEEAQI
jgi:hypothetical protein